MMSSSPTCDSCGQVFRLGARFCPECGRPVGEPGQPATQSSAGPPAGGGYPGYTPTTGQSAWSGYTPTTVQPAAAPAEAVQAPSPDMTPARDVAPVRDPDPARDMAAARESAPSWPSPAPSAAVVPWPPPSPPATPQRGPEPGPPARMPPPRHRGSSRWPLLAALIAVVVLGVGTGIGLTVLGHKSHKAGPAQQSTSAGPASPAGVPTSASAAPTPASSLPPEQQAAGALAALLARSGTNRSAITQAVTDVQNCSSDLGQDKTVFDSAAASRTSLLTDLGTLPDRSALPAAMLQDLTAAWQASVLADQDYAKWTQDGISQGCSTSGYSSDPNYQAASVPDQQATTNKQAFAALWSGIASKYDLPDYQWNQI